MSTAGDGAKVREVMEQLAILRSAREASRKWVWCAMAVQAYRVMLYLFLAMSLLMLFRSASAADVAASVRDALLSVAATAINIVLASWAIGYCDAKADGKL